MMSVSGIYNENLCDFLCMGVDSRQDCMEKLPEYVEHMASRGRKPLTMANIDLSKAASMLNRVEFQISQAAAKTEGTPYDEAVMNLLEMVEDFKTAIFKAKSQIERRESA